MSKFKFMKSIPTSREEMERNMFVMSELIKGGRLHIASHLRHSMEELARVRRLPNRRIDLLSISEIARLNANMMADFTSNKFEVIDSKDGKKDTETE